MNSIIYPSKKFFRNAKNLSWRKENFEVCINNDNVVNTLRNNMCIFDGSKCNLGFFGNIKLLFRAANFLALYYYSVGNGYKATFMLDQNKVLFEWE